MSDARLTSIAGAKLALFALAMFGFGYALVPLYEKICEATGINNLLNPQTYDGALADEARALRLEFDTNARGLVAMRPNLRLMEAVRPGETYSVIYTLENLSGKPLRAQAVPSFGPPRAGKWFRKIRCFCFDQLTLAPGEVRQEPVVFVVDAALPPDIGVIALSYTFFEVEGGAPVPGHSPEHSSAHEICGRRRLMRNFFAALAEALSAFAGVRKGGARRPGLRPYHYAAAGAAMVAVFVALLLAIVRAVV